MATPAFGANRPPGGPGARPGDLKDRPDMNLLDGSGPDGASLDTDGPARRNGGALRPRLGAAT